MDLVNDLGATLLVVGTGIQACRAATGTFYNPTTKRVAFSDGWARDGDLWGWTALFLGALGVAVAAWVGV